MLTLICGLILYWPQIFEQSVLWQKLLHQHLVLLIQRVQENPSRAGSGLLWFSLLYGVLHAIGPGHGKMVISTYLATHRSRLKMSLYMTLAASLLQGAVAIVLVSSVLVVLRLSSRFLHLGEFWLEKSSYLLMAVLGLILCQRAARRGWSIIATRNHHHHHDGCGCGHHHLPDGEQLKTVDGWRTRLAVILAMGIRPCSGAVLVLLFAKVLGVYLWGVLAAIVMAFGSSFTLLLVALLVFWSRQLAQKLAQHHDGGSGAGVAWSILSFAGGALLILVGVVLYISAQPMFMGGIGPFSH
ncbi:nickel/cobalt transporter [Acerihabitans sp. TG2]|uniref:nickel/cobalt transporter n=1 Tax=Acerihabitans sp. TG2 TaxID=3096008 RepID=UPI002B22D832|nr:nickel/cobalt transporter [Acerihabitans sp. TG2]MEA9392457.1 nickel/cobalt transporter [Acerihabitans sp. TG2]